MLCHILIDDSIFIDKLNTKMCVVKKHTFLTLIKNVYYIFNINTLLHFYKFFYINTLYKTYIFNVQIFDDYIRRIYT